MADDASMTDRVPTESRLAVLVEPRSSAVEAVEYAVREARDRRAETEGTVHLDAWFLGDPDRPEPDDDLRSRLETALAASEDVDGLTTAIEEHPLGGGDAEARTAEIVAELLDRGFDRVIVAADTELAVERLREGLGLATVELAPVERPLPRRPLRHAGELRRTVAVFGLTYLFYLALGGFTGGADLVTGAISASVVAVALSTVAFGESPRPVLTGTRLVRLAAVLPVFTWEILKANLAMAALILHPQLPMEPAIGRIETPTRDGLERMVLAIVITLTPGTLVVDVSGRSFTVHSLTAGTRRDLESGRLGRLVSWVFHGSDRSAEDDDR